MRSIDKPVITIIHALNLKIEVKIEPSVYAPHDILYIVPPGGDFLKMARTIYQAEKEKAEWIRKYDSLLNGLKYWRNRCFEAEE